MSDLVARSLLERIDALLSAATPAPWNAATAPHPDNGETFAEYMANAIDPDGPTDKGWVVWVPTEDDGYSHLVTAITGNGKTSEANAELIAAAPGLLAEAAQVLEAMQTELDSLR